MLSSFLFFAWAVLCLSIIYSDCRYRLVYNYQVFVALVLSIIGSFVYGYEFNLYAFFATFLIGFLFWKIGLMGGGDIKLLIVVVPCFDWQQLTLFFLLMSIIGFFIAVIVMILRSKRGVPYAPAISISHILIFYDLYLLKG